MKSHVIAITIDNRSIRAEPDTLEMSIEDDVRWTGRDGRRFSIEFEGDGPFERRSLVHQEASQSRRPTRRGRFKYAVVSEEDSSVRLDPVIIVDPPPSGGA